MGSCYAVVLNNIVDNVIVWDGNTEGWTPPQGSDVFLISEGEDIGIGYSYKDSKFTPPEVPEKSIEDFYSIRLIEKETLLLRAEKMTAGLSDAYIAGLLSEEQELLFKEWAKYKLELSLVEKQSGYPQNVTWPKIP